MRTSMYYQLVLKWPSRPGQVKRYRRPSSLKYTSIPRDYPKEPSSRSLLVYHFNTIAKQRYWEIPFDAKRLQLEEERLQQTLRWSHKNSGTNLLPSLADDIKEYFRNTCYRSNAGYYDYAGRTLLHWQILCDQVTGKSLRNKTYWEPLLERCIAPEYGRGVFWVEYQKETVDPAAEQDLQDLLHWAYQEQCLALKELERPETFDRHSGGKVTSTRLEQANTLLANIYETAEQTFSRLNTGRDRAGRSRLHWAILCRQTEVIKKLYLDLQAWPTKYNMFPLDMAVHMGDLELVRLLLSLGANPNWKHESPSRDFSLPTNQDWNKVFPLHRAVLMGRADIVEALLTASKTPVEVNAQLNPGSLEFYARNTVYQHYGCTALFYAARLHHWNIVALLLKNGADPQLTSVNKESAMHYALEAVPPAIDALSYPQIYDLLNLINEKDHRDTGKLNDELSLESQQPPIEQRLTEKFNEYFNDSKPLAERHSIIKGLKAFRAVTQLHHHGAQYNDHRVRVYKRTDALSTWGSGTYPMSLVASQKAIHFCRNYDGRTLVEFPGLSEAEKNHIDTHFREDYWINRGDILEVILDNSTLHDEHEEKAKQRGEKPLDYETFFIHLAKEHLPDRLYAFHLNRFYVLLYNNIAYLNEGKTGKAKTALNDIVQDYPDTLYSLVLKPLLFHHAYPKEKTLQQTTEIQLLRQLDPKKIDALLHALVSLPAVQDITLRDGVDPGVATELLRVADERSIKLDLEKERKFCRTIIERVATLIPTSKEDAAHIETNIKQPTQKRLAKVGPANDINLQMQSLVFYFKQWRLDNASSAVRFFKSKKTNRQREKQLELLESIRHIDDDSVKLGALVTISQNIGKEWNLFNSEMKKQVDRIIDKQTTPNFAPAFNPKIDYSQQTRTTQKTVPLKKAAETLKHEWESAYLKFEEKQQATAAQSQLKITLTF